MLTPLMGTLAAFVSRRATAIVVTTVVMLALAGCEAWLHLGYAGDRGQVLSSDASYYRTLQDLHQEFSSQDALFFVIRGSDPHTNRLIALDIGAQARSDPSHFTSVTDHIDLSFVRKRLALFMPLPMLREILPRLEQARFVLARVLARPALTPLFTELNNEVQVRFLREISSRLQRPLPGESRPSPTMAQLSAAIPLLERLLRGMSDSLHEGFVYQSALMSLTDALPAAASGRPTKSTPVDLTADIWISLDQGQTVLVSAVPRIAQSEERSSLLEADVAAARRIVAETGARWPQAHLEVTGMPVIGAEEMDVARQDSVKSTLWSFVGLVLLFGLAYRSLARPLLALATLFTSLVWTLAAMALVVGHLNVLTVTVLPMLVGLGIDFGIQVISRYEEERTLHGHPPATAMRETLQSTGASILVAGLTTGLSFGVTIFTGFAGVKELGILAGGGICISTFCMLVVLPAVILLGERVRPTDAFALRESCWRWLTHGERAALGRPYVIAGAAFAMSALCLSRLPDVRFDWNVLNLQDRTSPSVASAVHLLEGSNHSILTASVMADDLDQLRRLQARLSAQRAVAGVMSVALVMPPGQAEKVSLVRDLQAFLRTLPQPPPEVPSAVGLVKLQTAIRGLRSVALTVFTEARSMGGRKLGASLRRLVYAADELLGSIDQCGPDAGGRLDAYQRALHTELLGFVNLIQAPEAVTPMTYDMLPPALREQFVGKTGRLLAVVYPADAVWDEPGMKTFLEAVTTVARSTPSASGHPAEVTGSIVQIYESTRLAIEGYERVAAYALGVIVILVFAHFGRLQTSVLALAPLGIGLLWMFGLQAMLDVPLNVISMLALPLILGIGVANGIYVVKRYEEEGSASIFGHSTGRAILMSNLAAMVGFGSMMVSHYHGMYSFGFLMTLGVGTCGAASLLVLPALLTLLDRRSTADAGPGPHAVAFAA